MKFDAGEGDGLAMVKKRCLKTGGQLFPQRTTNPLQDNSRQNFLHFNPHTFLPDDLRHDQNGAPMMHAEAQ
jgi:hypothetical protein